MHKCGRSVSLRVYKMIKPRFFFVFCFFFQLNTEVAIESQKAETTQEMLGKYVAYVALIPSQLISAVRRTTISTIICN